ncbi:zinc dependent phospholipase C family protein [Rufibacter tibetensis]|uniref:S1/P1 Nuclease n=1 Tax=Rufibacter tibetensis TaxID=512763 RepID=A0A0P0C9A9_9BACT|nr:zinc dependent phospholipase C family protein [Rufibacter tibetensis]ALI97991.1 hypothetical protein DC20_02115 [Rufibacter tibetensis]
MVYNSLRKVLLVLGIILSCSILGHSWGFFGHKVIQQLAIYGLPKDMQGFYHRHMAHLVETSVRPDQRRNDDSTEAPRHFIDLEALGEKPLEEVPHTYPAAAAKYSTDTLQKYGIAPWHIIKMKERLTRAFQRRDTDSILYYSADLAHYIQDVHVPLHTSLNYDGQLTGQHGLHSLWESKVPEQNLASYNLQHNKARYLANPQEEIWGVVRSSHLLVPKLLEIERQVSQNFTDDTKYTIVERNGRSRKNYTDAFSSAYNKVLGTMVQDRMRASAEMTSSFWYTSWVDGGKPDLDKLLAMPRAKAEKKQLKNELKAWKKGTLLEKDLLLTKIRISLMNVIEWVSSSLA